MELNSLLILLEAAEYLERRDRGSARAPLCAGPRAGGRRRGRGRGGGPLTAPSVRRGRARLRLGAAFRRRLRQEENKGGRPGAQGPEQQVPPPARPPLASPGARAHPFVACSPGPNLRPATRPPPCFPAASLEEEARPGRGCSPARPAPPAPSPSSRGRASSASRVNSATRTAPAARGLLPQPLPAPKLFWTSPGRKKVVSGRWPVPRGSGETEARCRATWACLP